MKKFAKDLSKALDAVPLSHVVDRQILEALDQAVGGKLKYHGLFEDLEAPLGMALDLYSLRVRKYTEEMNQRPRKPMPQASP